MRITAVVILAIALTAGCATTPPPYHGSWGAYTQGYESFGYGGYDMPPQAAARLEAFLKDHPKEIDTRLILIGYYGHRRHQDDGKLEAVQKLAEHILWIIRNTPWIPAASTHTMMFMKYDSEPLCTEIDAAWTKAVEKHGNDPRVLANAAAFLDDVDLKRADTCMERAVKLAPDEPAWHSKYGDLLWRQSFSGDKDAKRRFIEKALAEYEMADKLNTKALNKPWLSNDIAKTALALGDLRKARERANDALKEGSDYVGESSHLLLARVDTAEGNKASAHGHIREAVAIAQKQNNKYGDPDRDLITEMLAKGDKNGVLEYLKLCETIYRDNDWSWRLKSFQDCLKAGMVPENSDWWGSAGSSPCTSTVMSTP